MSNITQPIPVPTPAPVKTKFDRPEMITAKFYDVTFKPDNDSWSGTCVYQLDGVQVCEAQHESLYWELIQNLGDKLGQKYKTNYVPYTDFSKSVVAVEIISPDGTKQYLENIVEFFREKPTIIQIRGAFVGLDKGNSWDVISRFVEKVKTVQSEKEDCKVRIVFDINLTVKYIRNGEFEDFFGDDICDGGPPFDNDW